VRCPRCHLETADPAPAFCRGCGAPLRFGEDPNPRALDLPLPLDRRAEPGGPPPPLPAPLAAARKELAALESSHWDLGAAAGLVGEPEPAPLAGATRGSAPGGRREEALPEPEVDGLEIRLRRPEDWRRAAAAAVDVGPFVAGGFALLSAFLGEAEAGLAAPATGVDGLLDLVARERVIVISVTAAVTLAVAVYATLAHALAGATLGKRLLGLAVVGPDGRRPSLGRSAARAGLAILSATLLGLGLLLALFTRSGRALHDLAARTWVVDARSRLPRR
jgi:uncharacterized RDD family membrane protein YckC